MLKAVNLMKSYGNHCVLKHIDLTVSPGESVGILGPNGSGKSTLIKLLSGEEPNDQGTIWLDDRPLTEWKTKERAKQIAVLPQGLPVIPDLAVEDYLLMGREPYQGLWPWYHQDDREIVQQWLERMDLVSHRARMLGQLSGGERQRVEIAKAMVQEPQYLLLDEPTNHLDMKYQCLILSLLKQLKREHHLAILVVIHDLNLAAQFCDQLLFLHEGRSRGSGKPQQLMQRELINQVFGIQPTVIQHPNRTVPQVLFDCESEC